MESYFASLSLPANSIFFTLGAALVIWGAGKFEAGAVFIAKAADIPKVVVGATIVSLATTFPEFVTSFSAALLAKPLMSVGNAVGSYLCNIGLIVGMTALLRAYPVPKKIFRFQGLYALAAALAMTGATFGHAIGRIHGVIFTLAFFAFLYLSWRQSSSENEFDESAHEVIAKNWVRPISWFIVGAVCVGAGCILLVQNGAQIARHAGVSELIIGLTIIAIGTSLPEITLAVATSIRGHVDLSLGNILGANVLNIFWVVGASALVHPLPVALQTRALDVPFSVLLIGLLLTFGMRGGRISRVEGGTILATYLLYLVLMGMIFL